MPQRTPLLVALLLVAGCASTALERYEFRAPRLGTEFRVVLYAPDEGAATAAAEAAWARVDALDAVLSDWRDDSELARLPARAYAAPAAVSPDLLAVLVRAQELGALSEGAFDVTVGPCTRLWRRSRRQGELPSPARLAEALAVVGADRLVVDAAAGTVRCASADVRLDLGGIAKGYVLDEVLAVLAAHGLERALVDGGGDVACGAPPPGRAGWTVEADGRQPLVLAREALCTSGDRYQFVVIDGARYSHIVDPRTGLGLTTPRQATVRAADGMTADAVATALCVLGEADGAALLAALEGVEGWVLE